MTDEAQKAAGSVQFEQATSLTNNDQLKDLHDQENTPPSSDSIPDEMTPSITLAVDEQGNLRISNDLRTVFDQFLLAIIDDDLDTILIRINHYLESQLNEPALSQAKDILQQYIGLKTALYDLEQSLASQLKETELNSENYLDLLKYQLDQRNRLRAEILAPEIHDAFYQEEERYDAFTYERMLVLNDKQLSQEQKAQQLAELEHQLPEDIQAARQETQLTDVLKVKTEALKASGADQDAIRSMRTEMFGEEAATRFDELDKERAEWQNRLDQYMNQREQLLSNKGISEDEKLKQIRALKESMFDSREQIRVSVYEKKSA